LGILSPPPFSLVILPGHFFEVSTFRAFHPAILFSALRGGNVLLPIDFFEICPLTSLTAHYPGIEDGEDFFSFLRTNS